MLVLSRKKNESIVINNDITVTVVEIRDDKVRLGIVAPREVPVHRQEVYDAIHAQPNHPFEPINSSQFPHTRPSPPEPWQPHPDEAPAIALANERRSHFLGQLAWRIREKSAKPVSLGDVAQTLIDAVLESVIDLGQAKSLDNLKQLLVQSIKRPE
jgi:carbon storage regulator